MTSKVSGRSKISSKSKDPASPSMIKVASTKSSGEAEPAERRMDAERYSQLFFYRNKVKLLERDFEAMHARAREEMEALLVRANQAVAVAAAGGPSIPLRLEGSVVGARGTFARQEGGRPGNSSTGAPGRPEMSGAQFAERDARIHALNLELAKRDEMMRTLAFRIAWKYQRMPRPFRLTVRALALPLVAPYLIYRSAKSRLRSRLVQG